MAEQPEFRLVIVDHEGKPRTATTGRDPDAFYEEAKEAISEYQQEAQTAGKIPAQQMALDMLEGWRAFVQDSRENWMDAEIGERGYTRESWNERHSGAYEEAIADLYQEAGRCESDDEVGAFLRERLLPFIVGGFKDKGG